MDGIAAASIGKSTTQIQQSVSIDMLKKELDANKDLAAGLLAGMQAVPTVPANPPGIGRLVDRRA